MAVPKLVAAWLRQFRSVSQISALTKIPQSTIYGYLSGRIIPSAGRYEILAKTYKKITYNYLRYHGFNQVDARAFSVRSPSYIEKIRKQMYEYAEGIAKKHRKDVQDVLRGMSRSKIRYEDYERNIS